jgi:hypothetical protein
MANLWANKCRNLNAAVLIKVCSRDTSESSRLTDYGADFLKGVAAAKLSSWSPILLGVENILAAKIRNFNLPRKHDLARFHKIDKR